VNLTSLIGANDWLEMYFRNGLRGDADWVEVGDGSFTYWQARLPQTTSTQVVSSFGDVKWRVRTRIVEDVGEPALAKEACLALNAYTAGWSFAYDDSDRSVNAILAVFAPIAPFPTDPMTRLAEAARLSAWMSDVIAERLAETVKGRTAFSHPAHQHALRTDFDGAYFYPETLRGRPEWVLDRTSDQFPTPEKTGNELAANLGVESGWLTVDQDRFIEVKLTESGDCRLSAYFTPHPILGECWRTYMSMPGVVAEYVVKATHAMTWKLFNDEESTLMGGWTYLGHTLAFEQWTTTSELRQLEKFAAFRGHTGSELTDRAMSLIDAMNATQGQDWDEFHTEGGLTEDERKSLGDSLIGAIGEQAAPLPDGASPNDVPNADRRLLWLERRPVLAVAAWFNPLGPTVATLEVCGRSGADDDYLVYFMRHPTQPDYRVIGPVRTNSKLEAAFAEGVGLLLESASLPTTLILWAPDELESSLAPILYDRVLEVSQAHDVDLVSKANKIASCMGRPWELAPGAQPPGLKTKYSREECGIDDLEAEALPLNTDQIDPGFTAWWSQVAKPENYVAHFCELPDAWDASLNLLIQSGGVQYVDPGPFILTYSSLATVFPKMNGS
jgi:hypothetical protein